MSDKKKKKRLRISLDSDLDFLYNFRGPGKIISFIVRDYFKGLSEEQKYLKAARILKELGQKPARRAPSESQAERENSNKGQQKAKARKELHGIPREFYMTD